ncbi:MAG: Clp protease N-terminal domain-containing protein [Solirubrobacteraceae bacterium]|nr:Clp protease N-terminal domain-containing protein [Solirubrobacteraceae bacterium]
MLHTPRLTTITHLARREAELLGHPEVGAEHLTLALLWEGQGAGVHVLERMGLDPSHLAQSLRRRIVEQDDPPTAQSRADLLHLAWTEAKLLEDHHVGTEHVLLALTQESRADLASQLLGDTRRLRRELLAEIASWRSA